MEKGMLYVFCVLSSVFSLQLPLTTNYGHSGLRCVGRWVWGASYSVWVEDTICYLGSGGGIYILNISDPTSPHKISEIATTGFVEGLFYSRGLAPTLYVACGVKGLLIIDVSNLTFPKLIGSYNTPICAQSVFCVGSYAYVADRGGGLRIIDISDPYSPTEVGDYDTPGEVCDVQVDGNMAYITDGNEGLRIIDLISLKQIGYLDTPGYAQGIVLSGVTPDSHRYAYVACRGVGLRIIDVSDPYSPTEVGYYDSPGSSWDKGWDLCMGSSLGDLSSYVYLADGIFGLRIVDVSNPNLPEGLGVYDTDGSARGVCIAGQTHGSAPTYVYVADVSDGLRIIDASVPQCPQEVGFYPTPDNARGIVCKDRVAYVADGNAGVYALDISDPKFPKVLGHYDTGYAWDIAISDTQKCLSYTPYAYVSALGDGLRVLDVSNLCSIIEVGCYTSDNWDWARGICYADNRVFVACGKAGLRIVDVSIPAQPSEIGYYDTPGYAWDVYTDGSYVYVADGDSGLYILDITSNGSVQELYHWQSPSDVHGVYRYGSYLYVAVWDAGLYVLDISEPYLPREVDHFDTEGYACDVYCDGKYVYVGSGNGGTYVIDVGPPLRWAGHYPGWWINSIYYDAPYIYAANEEAGISILEFIEKPTFTLLPNSPNPFKESTFIRFKLDLRNKGTVKIYDVMGRLVCTLLDEELEDGYHQLRWNGTNDKGDKVPGGIYFCKLILNASTATHKLVLIR